MLTLAFPCSTADITEIIGSDAFLDSLMDQELALKVRERETKTLEETLNIATRLEAYATASTVNEASFPAGRGRSHIHAELLPLKPR